MSLVLISNHNESIYDIIKKEDKYNGDEFKNPKQLAAAKRRFITSNAAKCKTKANATMGLAEEELPDPSNFLKKGAGKKRPPMCVPVKRERNFVKKPKIPEQTKVTISKKKTNFIIQNIRTVKEMKPKDLIPKVVIHASGDSKPLTYFVKAKEFAQVPQYLVKLKTQVEEKRLREKEAISIKQPLCRYITSDEREALLQGLKENWEELQIIYQGLPILTDTIPKINRKVKLENALKQLENDIVLVEKHPYLYVYKDDLEDK